MAVCGINHDHIDACMHKCFDTGFGIATDTNRGANQQLLEIEKATR